MEIEIPFGAFDSELMHQEINIPEGFEATIEGNKIILTKTESEDEQHRKWILEYLYDGLRKSDEQFKGQFKAAIAWLEKQGEQSLANKVEPKFHEGEWITNGDYTWKIVEVKPLDYILQSQEGNIVDDTISHVDEQFHSFTIKDAKDGDVLAAHECLVLFKEIDGLNIRCYCTYHYMNHQAFYVDTLQNKTAFHPATKEQQDLLFKKMHEAGYEWDAEKKELREIEQKSAEWSEEDEKMFISLKTLLNNASCYSCTEGTDKIISWLKSLKDRYIWKPSDEQIISLRWF